MPGCEAARNPSYDAVVAPPGEGQKGLGHDICIVSRLLTTGHQGRPLMALRVGQGCGWRVPDGGEG